MKDDWLHKLRRPQVLRLHADTKAQKLFFKLYKSKEGFGIEVVNEAGKEFIPNYLDYQGYPRQLLQTLERLREDLDFRIDWDNPDQEILLHQHPYLMGLLRLCEAHLINEEGNPITFSEEKLQLSLQIDPISDSELSARHKLIGLGVEEADFSLLSEDAIIYEQKIYFIQGLGPGFTTLPYFESSIPKEDLVFFLSVYASQLDNIQLSYENYRLAYGNESVSSEACLIFEKVDADQSLYLRAGQSLPGIDLSRMKSYPLNRYAQLNELESTITILPIEQKRHDELLNHIEKLLKKKGRNTRQKSRFFLEEDTFIIEEELARDFITDYLPTLLQNFKVIGSNQLKAYKIVSKPPKLNMRLEHGIDFLEGSVELQFDNDSLNLFDVIRQYRKQRYVLLSNGDKAVIDDTYIKRLERLFKKKAKGDEAQVSFFDLPLLEDFISPDQDDSPFKRSRDVFEGFGKLAKQKIKLPPIEAKLRKYQLYGFKWLNYLHEQNLGGCLADDMGLGKTLQAITMLAKVYQGKEELPSLVVGPRSLLHNWQKECEKFAPQLKTHIYYGPDRNWEEACKAQLIITTYALMRNDIKQIRESELYYAILDESQNIKNLEAQTTRAAFMLKVKHKLALSGTPVENKLSELYSLFRFLNPAMFGSPAQFNQDYGSPIQKYNDQGAIDLLRKKIFPFILRRKKKDVLADLPDKVEQTIYVDLGEDQKKLYELRRRFYQELINQEISSRGIQKSQFVIFQALNELRQIASIPEQFSDGKIISAKRELLLERLEETLANGQKALIFVNFLAALEILGEELSNMGVDFVSMSGATRKRQEVVNRFQEDPNCRVFLMTLKTGGTGLNLTAASTVFLYDPWWNVAAEHQAIDRAHRIGQVNKVHALRLIAAGTIEEKIRLLQEKKQELFENVIGADSAALKSMTQEDIDYILSK
ncbi:MAG: DEAD/DEAH box helicase [Bacteroidota bacterium]